MIVLLSAFACDPSKGSEEGYGWNWACGLARRGLEVHCITQQVNQRNIESATKPANVIFHYVSLPFGLDFLYSYSKSGMYLHYILWQWLSYKKAKKLHKILSFDVAHHVTWGSVQLGSFLYRLPVPFILGPVGGGQQSPKAFKRYFGKYWKVEQQRNRVSNCLINWTPFWKDMIKRAATIWVSNMETEDLVKKIRTAKVYRTLDTALPLDFFPTSFSPKNKTNGSLNLLWVGRFLPRKGVMLLLDVMEELRMYQNLTLTLVGDGEQRRAFQHAVEVKRLGDNVIWKGKIPFEEVKKYYAQYDAFFFTSLRESGGVQLVEAMAYGMPVVTLDLHGQAIIVNDETGFRCPCETPEQAIDALKEAILTLYNDPNLLTKMSKAAYEFALQQTWDRKIETVVRESYPSSAKEQKPQMVK